MSDKANDERNEDMGDADTADAILQARLAAAQWECGRHARALSEALLDWERLPPIGDGQLLESDVALRRLSDQIIYRFTKLQDAMGERLLNSTLAWLQEPLQVAPMRDKLDRLEKLGFIDTDQWLQWRDVRNRLAHEYPNAADLRLAALKAAMAAANQMLFCWGQWNARLGGDRG